jgi:hypothetical protein
MKNVISFPEKKMTRVKRRHRLEARNAVLTLSAASFLMIALFANNSLSRQPGPMYIVSDNNTSNIANLNRAIASAQPMNVFRDLEWEKKMSEKLGQAAREPAAYGKAASATDQLRFGALAGKYFFSQKDDMKLSEIRYVDSRDVGDRPVFMDPDTFLKAYGNLLVVEFENYSKVESETPTAANTQAFALFGPDKRLVGTASFVLDEDGRFLSLRVSSKQ